MPADWLEIERPQALLVDVHEPSEFTGGHIANAINLPLLQMRDRYAELPRHREIAEPDWRVRNGSGIQCGRGEPVKVKLEPASPRGAHY